MQEKTRIVIIGAAGRMGRTIRRLAEEEGNFVIAGLVDREEGLAGLSEGAVPVGPSLEALGAQAAEVVAIDFTAPEASMATAAMAAVLGVPLVIGTTGFSEAQKAQLRELAQKTPLFWSANMSVGINVLMRLLPELARALGPAYDMEMVEIHHGRKKDAPSGTALALGEKLAEARGWELPEVRCSARDGIIGARPQKEIGIQALRGGDVVGVHTVYFLGPGERIEVTHEAHSRENFAGGALRAARWLSGRKPGRLYSMEDTFDLKGDGQR
ncbi:MAG: 4-hydroxy-tetrahydrodipicolinate reductase [Desulfovibrio sp.]|nr:4-hydroxy-tetrahydrodipicolinate reductase [Desulfovibrio sp.]